MIDIIDINFQVLKQKYVSILYPQPDVTVGKKSLNPQTRGIMSMIHFAKWYCLCSFPKAREKGQIR